MAKSVGQRVTDVSGRQGVVLHTMFDYSKDENGDSRQECRVQWDDQSQSWDMAMDLRIVPNQAGDAFLSMANGMGKVEVEMGTNPILRIREQEFQHQGDRLVFLGELGLVKVRRAKALERGRQLTLDIRQRCAHGTPVKGGSQGQHDKRRESLAKAAALGEPMLVRKGTLRKVILIKKPPLGWAARAMAKGPLIRTKAQKRKARGRNKK